jgi:phosphoenolpyruvate carboxylase
VVLPGWYGFGSAIEAFLGGAVKAGSAAKPESAAALVLLQRMYRQWPFFKALLSNLDMVLAKSDLGIAARYVELVKDRKVGKKIFATIEAEWQRTSDMVSLISGDEKRLASNPSLARSIEHRFPYLDPLNHLQVELMRRYREGKEGEPVNARVHTGIHISINGVAAGLRNTG